MRWAILRALAMSWVIDTVAAPRLRLTETMRSLMTSAMMGSRPVVGSSKKTISGRAATALASATRFIMPPESSAGWRPATSPLSPTMASASSARSRARRRGSCRSRRKATFSQTARLSNRAAALEQHAEFRHQPGALAAGEAHRVPPVDGDLAAIGADQAQDAFQRHRLAGARPADDDQRLAGRYVEIDAREHRFGPEALLQATHADLGGPPAHRAKKSSVTM